MVAATKSKAVAKQTTTPPAALRIQYAGSFALRANGDCVARGDNSALVVMNANGSATVTEYNGTSCSEGDVLDEGFVDASWFENYVCAEDGFIFYNNAYPGTSDSGSVDVAVTRNAHKLHLPNFLSPLHL
ncbi:unnamed protein product [Phytophthora fragariaefolia]|uniref:Unnamed protein product n=1 Tax=Phytophthora fragariaefolia TaxID=1490495 RepID=A0A9W7CMR1_9STRA|nr:unnamed protein product [Phytophthora fragariaefolia]